MKTSLTVQTVQTDNYNANSTEENKQLKNYLTEPLLSNFVHFESL